MSSCNSDGGPCLQAVAQDIQEARPHAVVSPHAKCYLQVHFLGPEPPDEG